MNEIWKDIEGYEDLYQVSNYGRVKALINKRHKEERIRRFGINKLGYCQVELSKNGSTKIYLVHRLVALAFIPNPNNLPCVNHKDENPSNNNVGNLEWCSYKYNSNYGTSKRRISSKLKNHPNLSKTILQFTKDNDFIAEYPSISEIHRLFDYNVGHIWECCNGKRKSAYGYRWEYKDKAVC